MGGIYWLASYPKSGNTWFRTFLCNLFEDGNQPADINNLTIRTIASDRRWLDEVLGFDTADLYPDEVDQLRPEVYRWSLNDDEIGYYKIHDAYVHICEGEPLICCEATRGALYILRNPLDIVPSYANHRRISLDDAIGCMGSRDHALSNFRYQLSAQVRQKLLTWSEHVLSWVDAPDLACHVIRYEDMLNDPISTFTDAVRFLGLPGDSQQIEKAIRFSDFQELARQEAEKGFKEKLPQTERFFRRGKSGDWRNKLTPEQVRRIVSDHGNVMRRFGYLDIDGNPI